MRAPTPPPPAGEGGPLEAPPEAEKFSTFASFPIKIGHKCAIKVGLVPPTKLSENFHKRFFIYFFIWRFHAEKLNGSQDWPAQILQRIAC